jgi:uncharacterized metal-binding protein
MYSCAKLANHGKLQRNGGAKIENQSTEPATGNGVTEAVPVFMHATRSGHPSVAATP